jgi:hypothetical protein
MIVYPASSKANQMRCRTCSSSSTRSSVPDPGGISSWITIFSFDNGQQIIKVMGYAAGLSADRFHLLGLQELFLDMALFGDFLYDAGDANRLIFRIEKNLTL